jgi:transcription-repair coupling factor (superfamily II helicase)
MLAQAVNELKGQSPRMLTDEVRAYTLPLEQSVQITLPLNIALPEDYVADEALRLQLYRRLSGMIKLEDIEAIESELKDRFGPLPETAQNLLYQLGLKAVAVHAQVEAIVAEHRELVIRSEALENVDRKALQRALGERVTVRRREVRLPLGPELVWRAELERTLEVIRDLMLS